MIILYLVELPNFNRFFSISGKRGLPAASWGHQPDAGGPAGGEGRHQVDQGPPPAEDRQGWPGNRQGRVTDSQVEKETGKLKTLGSSMKG